MCLRSHSRQPVDQSGRRSRPADGSVMPLSCRRVRGRARSRAMSLPPGDGIISKIWTMAASWSALNLYAPPSMVKGIFHAAAWRSSQLCLTRRISAASAAVYTAGVQWFAVILRPRVLPGGSGWVSLPLFQLGFLACWLAVLDADNPAASPFLPEDDDGRRASLRQEFTAVPAHVPGHGHSPAAGGGSHRQPGRCVAARPVHAC